jgi:hypothetical protein
MPHGANRTDGVIVTPNFPHWKERLSEMPYKSVLVGRVFALRWLTPPAVGDLKQLGREMTQCEKRAGTRLINLSIIPAEISPPDSAVRSEMEAFNRIWAELCSAIHVVVGGSGFKNALMRSIVSTFALLGRERGLVQVHRSIHEALEEIKKSDAEVNLVILRGELVRAGIADDP